MKYLIFVYLSIHVIYFCSCLCTTISLHIVLLSLQFFRGMENRLLWKKRFSWEEDVHCSKLWKEGLLNLLSINNMSKKRYVCLINKCMVNLFCHQNPKFQYMGWDWDLNVKSFFLCHWSDIDKLFTKWLNIVKFFWGTSIKYSFFFVISIINVKVWWSKLCPWDSMYCHLVGFFVIWGYASRFFFSCITWSIWGQYLNPIILMDFLVIF